MTTLRIYGAIFVGGFLGGLLRVAIYFSIGTGFPFATLLANGVGSAIIGFWAVWTDPAGKHPVPLVLRHGVMVGFCGGLTTFSLFSLESAQLFQQGKPLAALTYVALTLIIALTAVALGAIAARKSASATSEKSRR